MRIPKYFPVGGSVRQSSEIKNELASTSIPIYFNEFDVKILNLPKAGDTLVYTKSGNEYFKFIIYDPMGKSYCERYLGGKMYEKGNFENSLDTLKKYISK